MFANHFSQIKNSVHSRFVKLKLSSSEPISIPIITDACTGVMTVFDDSNVRTLAHSKISAINTSHLSPNEFDNSSSSSLGYSEQESSLEASSSSDSIYTRATLLAPNSRLFRGSQDEFGFDVYIADYEHYCGPAYLFECPVVLPWDELVVALAEESGRETKDIVLSSKFYACIVDDNVSYQAWLAWSRESDGPCSTDLWLT